VAAISLLGRDGPIGLITSKTFKLFETSDEKREKLEPCRLSIGTFLIGRAKTCEFPKAMLNSVTQASSGQHRVINDLDQLDPAFLG
jgi:hypothetical protein